ncbi:hypothetical protein Pflav_037470 [Phytohabitans flavus]|uniref:Uncharacterized protein n=1 Tax=Phytohabitans flavus TaxID=1076124 RepID=A0A6F8XU67_9ACTN|nr:hypothetical protein Pflav_037470 [Phytohabitans flavus]
MDDAALVYRVEGLGRLGHDPHRDGRGQPLLAGYARGERLAVDELHHQVRGAPALGELALASVVHLDDAGVAYGGEHPRLGQEARSEPRVGRQAGQQHLDRDRAAEGQVGRPPHVAHPTGGDAFV